MSNIGKVFVIVNLVLAAAFVGWAAKELKTSDEWRAKFTAEETAHKATAAKLNGQVDDLTTQLGGEKARVQAVTSERDEQKNRADRLSAELDDAKRNNQKLSADLGTLKERLGDYNKQLESLAAGKDRAIEEARAAERARDEATDAANAAQLRLRDAQDAAAALEARVASMEEELGSVQNALEKTNVELATLVQYTGVALSDVMPEPLIEGAVVQVKLDITPGLVMLNVGSNQNVKQGMTFDVYRGGQYKGEVKVQDVQANMCSALITMAAPGAVMTQGDRASTRL
jgi:hypothetical protein